MAAASPALAYRTAAELPEIASETPVAWPSGRVEFDVYAPEGSALSRGDQAAALMAAFEPWEAAACGAIDFALTSYAERPAAPGDGRNTLAWVASDWEALGLPAAAAAFTDVLYERIGEEWFVREADLYVNAEQFRWTTASAAHAQPAARVLEPVLMHELGHALGLLHPCEEAAEDGVPECSADAAFAQTMMFPFYDSQKLALADDDRDGLCAVYGCPTSCEPSSGGPPEPEPGETPGSGGACGDASCTERRGEEGDPCARDSDCASETCGSGFCQSSCVSTAEDSSERTCSRGTKGLGEACAASTDCIGGLCLAVGGDAPVCSRSCSESACAPGWQCLSADGAEVCAQPVLLPGGGCSVAPAGASSIWSGAAWLLLTLIGLSYRRSAANQAMAKPERRVRPLRRSLGRRS